MRKYLIILFLFIIGIAAQAPTSYYLYATFEDGDRTAGGRLNVNSSGLSCMPDGMRDTTIQARIGRYAMRSIVRTTDVLCGGSFRDEYLEVKNGPDSVINNRFYAVSFFPQDYYPGGLVDIRDELIMQWKSTTQDIYPFVAVWVRPDASGLFSNLVLVVQYNITNPIATTYTTKTYTIGRLTSDKWTDLAFDIGWKYDNTGYIKVYLNNNPAPVVSYSGPTIALPFNTSAFRLPSFRNGIYKFPWHNNPGPFAITQRIMYFDELKIGSGGTISDYFITPNVPPSADAGLNSAITLPTNSQTLNGSGSTDIDGTISTYLWSKVGLATGTITNPNIATTTVTGLTAGVDTFQLKVVDNTGLTDSAIVIITINSAPPVNQPPIVGAGTNQTITLPTNSTALTGTATDADGSISSKLWSQVSGPSTAIISAPNSLSTTISSLIEGQYKFQFQATDNLGLSALSIVTITIYPAVVPQRQVKLKIKN